MLTGAAVKDKAGDHKDVTAKCVDGSYGYAADRTNAIRITAASRSGWSRFEQGAEKSNHWSGARDMAA